MDRSIDGFRAQNATQSITLRYLQEVPTSHHAAMEWLDTQRKRSTTVAQALYGLEEKGGGAFSCEDLAPLLYRVYRSRAEGWKEISASDLRDARNSVSHVIWFVDMLRASEVRRLVLPSSQEHELETLMEHLEEVRSELDALQAKHDKRHSPRTDSAVAAVIRYVIEATGTPRDREVSDLLAAALGKKMDMKRWRQQHADLCLTGTY